MNEKYIKHVATLLTCADRAEPELPDGAFEVVEEFLEAILPEHIVEEDGFLIDLKVGVEFQAKLWAKQLAEQRDGDVQEYLEERHERANRAHADDPTGDNLRELERIGGLLR